MGAAGGSWGCIGVGQSLELGAMCIGAIGDHRG